MKVYEAIADALAAESSGAVFGVMGDANLHVWATLLKDPRITIYTAMHEAAAVLMADAYARVSGKVGIATITCGPGVSHAATSIVAAARAQTPLVIFTGEAPSYGRQQIQALDQRRFAEACDAQFQPIYKSDNLAEDIRNAFFTAKVRKTPVLLNLPFEMITDELQWDWNYKLSADAMPRQASRPDDAAVEQLADLLARAERPVFIVGRGGMQAKHAIERLAERCGALLATSLLAKGLFYGNPNDLGIAGLFASAAGEKLLADADLVVGMGASLNFYTTEGGFLFPDAEVARIDIDAAPRGLGVVPGLYVQGDAGLVAEALSQALEQRQVRNPGYRTTATHEVLNAPVETPKPAGDGLDPRIMMRDLSNVLPDNVQVVTGLGHFWAFPILYMSLPAGGTMQFASSYASIGQGLPFAIGAQVAGGARPTLLIEGDGGLMQHLQELHSVSENKLSLVVLVFNDAGYGAEVHKLRKSGFDGAAATWTSPDFVSIARAVGGDGALVERQEDLAGAIAAGFKHGGLYLIDARISKTTLSDPYLKMHFGSPNIAPRLRPGA